MNRRPLIRLTGFMNLQIFWNAHCRDTEDVAAEAAHAGILSPALTFSVSPTMQNVFANSCVESSQLPSVCMNNRILFCLRIIKLNKEEADETLKLGKLWGKWRANCSGYEGKAESHLEGMEARLGCWKTFTHRRVSASKPEGPKRGSTWASQLNSFYGRNCV